MLNWSRQHQTLEMRLAMCRDIDESTAPAILEDVLVPAQACNMLRIARHLFDDIGFQGDDGPDGPALRFRYAQSLDRLLSLAERSRDALRVRGEYRCHEMSGDLRKDSDSISPLV